MVHGSFFDHFREYLLSAEQFVLNLDKYLSVIPKLKQMDPSIYEAALDLGATPFTALFKVVIILLYDSSRLSVSLA